MAAALVLERVAADGRISAREWRDLLAPELRELPARASPTSRRLLDLMADPSVRFDPSARAGARALLEERFGYPLAPSPVREQNRMRLVKDNVSEPDALLERLLRRAGSPMRPVRVGIVDLGFSDDPSSTLWTNAAEAEGEPGVDDDGNGWIDDVNGWDFKSDEANLDAPYPAFARHGNHVRARAVAGSPLLEAISTRAFGISTTTRTSEIVAALRYSVENGARVINVSANVQGPERVLAVRALIEEFPEVLFVKSAGNRSEILGSGSLSPENELAAIRLPNLVVVAASDGDWLAGFSNRSSEHVDLVAPGERVLGRVGAEEFSRASGTSMAAAAVTNAAAKCLAIHPELTPSELAWILRVTSQNEEPEYWQAFGRSTGPIDPAAAIQLAALLRLRDGGVELHRAIASLEIGPARGAAWERARTQHA